MSDGAGGVGSSGGYRRSVNESVLRDGSAFLASFTPTTLYWINVAADSDGEFLQLFQQTAAPILNDVPFMVIGKLGKDGGGNGLHVFGVDGFSLSSFAFGVSSTLATFTGTVNPGNYGITYGLGNP